MINTWISAALVAALASALTNADGAAPGPALSTGAVAESMATTSGQAAVAPAPAVTVVIEGPNPILPNEGCTWTAVVDGKWSVIGYTFEWDGGTMIDQYANKYSAYASLGGVHINVRVYDGSNQLVGSASKYVTVTNNTGPCMF